MEGLEIVVTRISACATPRWWERAPLNQWRRSRWQGRSSHFEVKQALAQNAVRQNNTDADENWRVPSLFTFQFEDKNCKPSRSSSNTDHEKKHAACRHKETATATQMGACIVLSNAHIFQCSNVRCVAIYVTILSKLLHATGAQGKIVAPLYSCVNWIYVVKL